MRRLSRYLDYFNGSGIGVLFLAHPALREMLMEYRHVEIEYLARPAMQRVLDDSGLVGKYRGKALRYFSYGIPIYSRMSSHDWLHLSNALPFGYRECTLSVAARIKNRILFQRFKDAATHPDIVSAESNFLLRLYAKQCESPRESMVLRNGSDVFSASKGCERLPRMLTVGIDGYKRLAKVVEQFERMRRPLGLQELVVVGSPHKAPAFVRNLRDVRITGFLSAEELNDLYATSRYYISASEIENSSVAVMEALQAGLTCILSRIPSHLEMFHSEQAGFDHFHGSDFFVVDRTNLIEENSRTWATNIGLMCDRMGLSGRIPETKDATPKSLWDQS